MSQLSNFPSPLSSSGHFFHRGGIQQSPATFSPHLPNQGPTLYNGMLGSQSGFPQNNFPASNFNNYTHVEPPVWLPDTRVSSAVTNMPLINVGRNNKQLYPGKEGIANVQNLPQACCVTQSSAQKNMGTNLPFSNDSFKGFDKDVTFPVKSVANLDPQSWYCGQSVVSYGNQQTQNVQQSYKCVEQFSSCLVAQNMLLHEQSTTKQTNVSFGNGQSCSLEQKDEFCAKFSERSVCPEQDKKQPQKYFDQNAQLYGPSGYGVHGKQTEQQQQQQQQECYSNQSVFGSSSEMCSPLSAEGLYSQASLFLHVNNSENQLASKPQAQFANQKQLLHYGGFPDSCKMFSPSEGQLLAFQHFQEHDKGAAYVPMACGVAESSAQREAKPATSAEVSGQSAVPQHGSYEQAAVAKACAGGPYGVGELAQMCPPGVSVAAGEQLHRPDCNDGARNKDASSLAGESDIIVEETEEEDVSESEISVDECIIKSSCLVCDTESASNQLVYVSKDSPVTSSSRTPVAARLVQAVGGDEQAFSFCSEFMCRRCLNLVETVDTLETKLTTAKHSIVQLLGPKISSAQQCSGVTSVEIKQDVDQECKLDGHSSSVDNLGDDAHARIFEDKNVAGEGVVADFPEQAVTVACDGALDYERSENKRDAEQKNCDEAFSGGGNEEGKADEMRGNLRCETCGEYFCSNEYLSIHQQQQHSEEHTHFCGECHRGFTTQHASDRHALLHAGQLCFQCDRCGKQFRQRYSLENHLRRHDGRFRFVCSVCAKGFVSKHALQIHLRLHSGDCPFMCEHCGRRFKSASNLTVHIRSCSGDLPYRCKKCDRKFTLRAHLRSHISARHGNNARAKCSLCSKGFSRNSDLVAHMKSHSKEKLHKCNICGKCYSSVSNLNQHSKIHFEDRLYKCDICTKNFKHKSTLIDHINQHKGLKLYECDSCKKRFVSVRSFHAHQKWHAGTLKRYTCKVCGKTMFSGLSVHMLTHTQQKPHSCAKCGTTFSVRSSLNKHIRKHCKKV
ncbi:zinc finger protein 16-like [Bacillus rossius redtenbacheri]|uniref:zinc finger protein 16-like n=1 Tax=Bacillus rossius redtenbacheri TaxID=93214 RepID=UPI002FDD7AEC